MIVRRGMPSRRETSQSLWPAAIRSRAARLMSGGCMTARCGNPARGWRAECADSQTPRRGRVRSVVESYERACSEHEWSVPERYNIAADVCDQHPRDKAAMVWERFDGERRELDWGELQDLSNQAAHMLREHGVEKGDRVAVVLPPTPETAAIFFGTWKLGAILLSMSVLYGDDGIRHRLEDATPKLLITDTANAERFDASLVDELLVLDDASRRPARRPADRSRLRGHLGRRSGPALLHVGHHGQGEGHRPRPPLHPRPRGVHLLPRHPRRRALPRHGRVGLGRGHLPPARPLAPRRRPVRPPARGRVRPRRPARLPLAPRGHQCVHDPDRDAGDDGHRARRASVTRRSSGSSARRASR